MLLFLTKFRYAINLLMEMFKNKFPETFLTSAVVKFFCLHQSPADGKQK